MNTSNPTDIKSIIDKNKKNIAFVIGNGINLHFNWPSASWRDLLLDLWNKFSHRHSKDEIPKGISFPEFYNMLELQEGSAQSVRNEFIRMLNSWELAKPDKQKYLLEKIMEIEAPILTTNFDNLMSQSLEFKEPFKLKEQGKRKTFMRYYPWSSYYSGEKLRCPNDGFAIWHINGMKKYPLSIKLGLSHYMNSVSYVRRTIKNQMEMTKEHPLYNTWFNIFLRKNLFIFGLSLGENEIFLRWLLFIKAKHHNQPRLSPGDLGWFVMTKQDSDESEKGKKLFLESVGIKVLKVKDYDTIYETPWS